MSYREFKFASGHYYHIYSRGNEKKEIFLDNSDYERFLVKMKDYVVIHKVSIVCYCLMPNHFHLIVKQNSKEPLSSFIHRLTVSYSMYFNKRYNRVGHLFQGHFKAKFITTNEYILHLSRYIHLNPVEIIKSAMELENYPWSSYPEYLNITNIKICEKEIILSQFGNDNSAQKYKEFINKMISNENLNEIKNFIIEP